MKRMILGISILGLCVCSNGVSEKFAIEMVRIPGGVFRMGADSGRAAEKPAHDVTLSDFCLSKTPVTVGQFKAFADGSGYRTEAERGDGSVVFTGQKWEKKADVNWRRPGFSQGDDCPVTCVSWSDCQEYIKWLNARSGQRYRLPTEAEWEYAARGGKSGHGEKDLDSSAWTERNSGGSTHPVGQKRPNAYGLYDMIGNVWEWCSDWYGNYTPFPQANPTGPANGLFRVNRGGCWYGASWDCLERRGKNTPEDRGHGLGFRLASGIPAK